MAVHRHPQTADELLEQAARLARVVTRELGTEGHTVILPEVAELMVQAAHELLEALANRNPHAGN